MSRELFGGISDQGKASGHRLIDADVLLERDRGRGAMDLAGYGVECLLKKKLMERFGCNHLLELEEELHRRGLLSIDATVFTHHLERLLKLAGGLERIRQDKASWVQFALVNQWVPAWRYSPASVTTEDAADFLEAVKAVVHWIEVNV